MKGRFRMDFEAMRGAVARAVGFPPGGGWAYLPGQAEREARLREAGELLFEALDCYRGSKDPVTEHALERWRNAAGAGE